MQIINWFRRPRHKGVAIKEVEFTVDLRKAEKVESRPLMTREIEVVVKNLGPGVDVVKSGEEVILTETTYVLPLDAVIEGDKPKVREIPRLPIAARK